MLSKFVWCIVFNVWLLMVFLHIAGKKGDKAEESTEAEPMDATNGAETQR